MTDEEKALPEMPDEDAAKPAAPTVAAGPATASGRVDAPMPEMPEESYLAQFKRMVTEAVQAQGGRDSRNLQRVGLPETAAGVLATARNLPAAVGADMLPSTYSGAAADLASIIAIPLTGGASLGKKLAGRAAAPIAAGLGTAAVTPGESLVSGAASGVMSAVGSTAGTVAAAVRPSAKAILDSGMVKKLAALPLALKSTAEELIRGGVSINEAVKGAVQGLAGQRAVNAVAPRLAHHAKSTNYLQSQAIRDMAAGAKPTLKDVDLDRSYQEWFRVPGNRTAFEAALGPKKATEVIEAFRLGGEAVDPLSKGMVSKLIDAKTIPGFIIEALKATKSRIGKGGYVQGQVIPGGLERQAAPYAGALGLPGITGTRTDNGYFQ